MSLLTEGYARDTLAVMSRWKLLAVTAFATLALSGCLRFDANLTLAPNDTVTGEFIVAVKEGTGPQYGTTDRTMSKDIWDDYPAAKALADARVSDFHGDGYVGIAVRFANEPLATFAPTATAWGITRNKDEFVVSGPSNARATESSGSGDAGAFSGDLSQLSDAHLTVAITFPGAVASANGSVKGRTVTWNLTDGPETLDAKGSALETGDPAVGMAYVIFAVIALGAIAYALAGRLPYRHT